MRSILVLVLVLTALIGAADLPDSFVKASGSALRDHAGSGAVVALRGVNLGGWLNVEGWMCPFTTAGGNVWQTVVDATLTTRFGSATKNALVDAYQDAWITTADLDAVAAAGMTLVRVPFTYLLFQERQPSSTPLAQVVWKADATAFARLDWVIGECAKRRIYVLLDFHLAEGVGGQGTPSDPDAFWNQGAYQDRLVEIWRRVAARYAGNATVVGYDLLNEPWSRPAAFYDRCYRAIRAVDPDHAIFMELWTYDTMLAAIATYQWSNVVCSLHFYPSAAEALTSLDSAILAPLAAARAAPAGSALCPLHVGEFQLGATDGTLWQTVLRAFEDNRIPWTSWTLKTVDQGGWSLLSGRGNAPAAAIPDLDHDAADAIRNAWASWTTATPAQFYAPIRDTLACPLAVDDVLQVPPEGVRSFTAGDLLANDRDLSTAARLSVQLTPGRTAHGTLQVVPGAYVYQADPGFLGNDTLTYRTGDERQGLISAFSATVAFVVAATAPALSPYGLPDGYVLNRDGPLRVEGRGVLANDGDGAGRLLSAVLAAPPGHGTVELDACGAFTYRPAAGFTGADRFTYRVTAGPAVGPETAVTLTVRAPAPGNGDGLLGSYYANTGFSGTPATRVDAAIDMVWDGTSGPGFGGVGATNYSVRWNGFITAPYSGTWTFNAAIDDVLRVWIDGVRIISDNGGASGRILSGSADLIGGQAVPIRIELTNYGGGAIARLRWSHALSAMAVVPSGWLTSVAAIQPPAVGVTLAADLPTPAVPAIDGDGSAAPRLSGRTVPSATVLLYDLRSGQRVAQVSSDAGGAWSWTAGGLSAGTRMVAVQVVDGSGAISARSAAVTLTIAPPTDGPLPVPTATGGSEAPVPATSAVVATPTPAAGATAGGGSGGCGLGGGLALALLGLRRCRAQRIVVNLRR